MTTSFYTQDLPWLKKTYFSHPDRHVTLKKGDILVRQGGYNDRLYLILNGTLAAYVTNPDGKEFKLFEASKNMFAGVYSFFSRTFTSLATVIAEDSCLLAYISRDQKVKDESKGKSLFEQFMPVVVTNLAHRQQHEQQIAFEKERMLKKLVQSEKMASLGQMAAGISHELNNAISVLERNTQWLSDRIGHLLGSSELQKYFNLGLQQGRISSRELREQTTELQHRYSLDEATARKAAEIYWHTADKEEAAHTRPDEISRVHNYWELGATFHDMKIAATLSASVVRSVKALASRQAQRKPGVQVNNSIKEALALLGSPLRKVTLELDLSESLPPMTAASGELVQIWTNLIRNAVESMSAVMKPEDRKLRIQTRFKNGHIRVSVMDNGPGIPSHIRPKIFQPNFTTKEKGLEFGLGLGLTIAERIVSEYSGDISVRSKPGRTVFIVKLPAGGG
jgi:hypothetical protein